MEKLLTTVELAETLKVTRQAIWNWRKEGLPFFKIGSAVRFDPLQVRKWLEEKGVKND